MNTETYSFLSVRELIDAKLQRKLSLQAEIAKIDGELTAARQLLDEIPSQRRADAEPAAVAAAPERPAPVVAPVIDLPPRVCKRSCSARRSVRL
jgi:hypothetical protein